ncbi:putative disease resistance protein [Cucumis melo var. makuwa]|uniref:Disease resistance protein n=1 Tax=Cucumis melo var. makuwa TaxID=1194695 RepID=A0A5A7UUG6_CUCMM|nr:putative disease resistance protein [Cucumis melo var. makuwa]TYK23772.1 putative disease resistance protein [Cucumis melo var. makuwa]
MPNFELSNGWIMAQTLLKLKSSIEKALEKQFMVGVKDDMAGFFIDCINGSTVDGVENDLLVLQKMLEKPPINGSRNDVDQSESSEVDTKFLGGKTLDSFLYAIQLQLRGKWYLIEVDDVQEFKTKEEQNDWY